MPNWIEGTMKLRGAQKDIRRFFSEGVEPSNWPDPKDNIDQVVNKSDDEELWFEFKNEPHIVGTRRAFITDDEAYMCGENGVCCVNVKQAWAFDAGSGTKDLERWTEISTKYNVDIKLFGFERGMEFAQEVIVLRGRKPIVNDIQYEDWDWDCPFPKMGG